MLQWRETIWNLRICTIFVHSGLFKFVVEKVAKIAFGVLISSTAIGVVTIGLCLALRASLIYSKHQVKLSIALDLVGALSLFIPCLIPGWTLVSLLPDQQKVAFALVMGVDLYQWPREGKPMLGRYYKKESLQEIYDRLNPKEKLSLFVDPTADNIQKQHETAVAVIVFFYREQWSFSVDVDTRYYFLARLEEELIHIDLAAAKLMEDVNQPQEER